MRVKPILQIGLVAGALALPGVAWPLGLGKLTVDSALGQPLSARIELLSATKDELDSLTAKVADSSLYRQNNLTYQGVLTRTRITVERGAGDVAYLRVTSPTPVTEPYLDLLVDVNWSAGRVVRDYTFLLDPPGAPAAVAVEPVAPLRIGTAPAARPPAAGSSAGPGAVSRRDGDGYEVKRGDTLSKIAKEFKPETVTLEQMLVALFKSNQSAFDGANMNRLRSGAIITLPNAVEASATPASEAASTVRVQASDWRAYRDRLAGAAPTVEEGAGRAAGGRIGTAVEERTPAARAGSDQLRVSKDAGTAKGAGGAESAVAREAQLRDAQSRIAELEKTVRDLQRATELRSPTLAQAQAQAEAAKGKAPTSTPTPAPVAKAPEPAKVVAPMVVPAPVVTPPPAPKAVEAPKVEAPKAEAPKAEAPKIEAPKVEAPKVEAPKVEAPKVEAPAVEAPKVVAPKAVPKAPVKEPPGFFEDLLGGTPPWAIGAGALAILGGIAALIAARRRKTTKFEDSIISGTDIKTNTVFGSTGGGVVNTGDNSLASDFSREGLGNIDTDEVDPIAEAEVYLAYGRDAQAEEILKDALKKDPQRQEIHLKLLEIHAQHNKPSAFETVASELYSVSNGQGEIWQKAVALGRQLDPNNPMFSEGGVMVNRPAAEGAGAMNFTAGTATTEVPKRTPLAPAAGLDFQMDEEISISPTSGGTKSPTDILAGAQSELERSAKAAAGVGESAHDKSRAMAMGAAGLAGAAIATGKSGFDSFTTSMSETVGEVKGKAVEAARFDLDFKLDDAEKPAPMGSKAHVESMIDAAAAATTAAATAPTAPTAAAASALTRPAAAMELDKLDLSFDPDRTTFEDPTPSVLDGQWHDAATKLDLAKAYQEMGDVEGAREILQEVLHEGDDQQKVEAKALLAKLG